MQRVERTKKNITTAFMILVTGYLAVVFNRDLTDIRPIWFGINCLVIMYAIYRMINEKNLYISGFSKWYLLFVAYCVLSLFWTNSIENSFNVLKTSILFWVTTFFLSMYIITKEDIIAIIKCIFWACLVTAIYIYIKMGFTFISNVRIGFDNLGKGWNANSVGLIAAVGAASAYFLLPYIKLPKILLLFCIGVFTVLSIFTGSRKAILLLIFVLSAYTVLSHYKNKKITVSFLFLALGILIVLLFTNETLYRIMGSRIENMVKGFFGEGTDEGSFNERQNMIISGLRYFSEKPLFGHGINGFMNLYGDEFGNYGYAHNNFVELLVGIGLIGFTIYYSIYIYLLYNLSIKTIREKDNISAFLFSVIVSYLIMQYAFVSYNDFLNNFFLLVGIAYIRSFKRKNAIIEEALINKI